MPTLEEGAVVEISNFSIIPATRSYHPIEHPYLVNFQFSTFVCPHKDDHSISRYGFSFKTFSDIISTDLDDRFIFGENKKLVVLAKIVDVHYESGWFYNSYNVDEKKIIPDGHDFVCNKCKTIVKNVIPRFLVKFDSMDDTGTCIFAFFDREFYKLAGCSIVEMIDRVIHKHVHHDDDVEKEICSPCKCCGRF
ncbi:hypothetical protein K1719_033637 [Acacia pycnantha]|nr:hypothetical protein K1719_033637 [Acacia pycnantha]